MLAFSTSHSKIHHEWSGFYGDFTAILQAIGFQNEESELEIKYHLSKCVKRIHSRSKLHVVSETSLSFREEERIFLWILFNACCLDIRKDVKI